MAVTTIISAPDRGSLPLQFLGQDKQIELLFRNIADGIRRVGVSEMNSKLADMLTLNSRKHQGKSERIKHILTAVAREFEITPQWLLHGPSNTDNNSARKVAYILLHIDEDLQLPFRYISLNVFGRKYHTSVTNAVKSYKTRNPKKVKEDRILEERLYRIQQSLQFKK